MVENNLEEQFAINIISHMSLSVFNNYAVLRARVAIYKYHP